MEWYKNVIQREDGMVERLPAGLQDTCLSEPGGLMTSAKSLRGQAPSSCSRASFDVSLVLWWQSEVMYKIINVWQKIVHTNVIYSSCRYYHLIPFSFILMWTTSSTHLDVKCSNKKLKKTICVCVCMCTHLYTYLYMYVFPQYASLR